MRSLAVAGAAVGLLLSACSSSSATEPATPSPGQAAASPTQPQPGPSPTSSPILNREALSCEDPFEGVDLRFSTRYWEKTDFCRHSVDYSTIISGGPPPDGIPAVDHPTFENVSAADEWLGDEWAVVIYQHDDEVRAYPLAILMFHEIVNDTVAGQPVALTFCPLCNSVIAFNRIAPDGRELDFGTSGNLRNSDLIMYDRQTESWWQQITGEAIVGEYTGARLEFLPSQFVSWADAREQFPDLQVLSRETGFPRNYGQNPYAGYDRPSNNPPFLFRGPIDGQLPAVERVAAVKVGETAVAYPFSDLREVRVVNDVVAGTPLVVFWQPGVKSALDSSNMEFSRDVGTSAIYGRQIEGQILSFIEAGDGMYRDEQTESLWNFFGAAVSGPLEGAQLPEFVSGQHFWFAWSAFEPETEIRSAHDG